MLAKSVPLREVYIEQFHLPSMKSNFAMIVAFHLSPPTVIQFLVFSGFGEDRSLHWVEGDAEALSFADGSMDGYTIAFGIRNVTHIEKVLSEAYR